MSTRSDDPGHDEVRRKRDEEIARAAGSVGNALGRFARKATRVAREAAETARPEAERVIRRTADQTRAAARAARPHVERAARDTRRYLEDHDEELKRAGRTGARFMASRAVPPTIRPLVDAMGTELRRPPAPLVDRRRPAEPGEPGQPPER